MYVNLRDGKLSVHLQHKMYTCMKVKETENSRYFPCFQIYLHHANVYVHVVHETENLRYFPPFFNIKQHVNMYVHVGPGNGKLALLSTVFQYIYNANIHSCM